MPKRIIHTDRFLADAEAIHGIIIGYSGGLRVGCDHCRAMQRLHDALLQAIIDVTGREAPWIYRSNSGPRDTGSKKPTACA
ncbi:hypothetical protein [Allomesorhizobium camelthorni]|uniref:Transposase n=1 Tax=Allomesorhizobium camelthorni TaxID=475069 RepID=A0A6G4WN76_9HYPH|nr:hypothetical protein [Mesorhizobium camelthorni]NGO56094.1 hypothetical protein [Mesorhizobium camelthorni]